MFAELMHRRRVCTIFEAIYADLTHYCMWKGLCADYFFWIPLHRNNTIFRPLVPSEVENIMVIEINITTIQISWNPPSTANGFIKGEFIKNCAETFTFWANIILLNTTLLIMSINSITLYLFFYLFLRQIIG